MLDERRREAYKCFLLPMKRRELMKRLVFRALLAAVFTVAGSMAWAQMPAAMNRSMVSAVSSRVQVMTSDIVAVGTVENAGSLEDLDVVMPLADKPTKRHFQKFSLRVGRVMRDTVGGAAVFSNTVVEVLATVAPAVTNVAACPNQKNQHGVFLMNRLVGRTELFLSRFKSSIEEVGISSMAAGVDGLSWGQVSNGLQMVVFQLSPAMASTNDTSVRLGVAVRNVSNGPIVVNRAQARKRLTVAVNDREVANLNAPVRMGVASNAPAIQPTITLQPNQIAMLAPKGNPDSGFAISLPPGGTWSVKATYEPTGEKNDGSPFWTGRLTSGALEVNAFKSPVRAPPRTPRPTPVSVVSAPTPAVERKPSADEATRATSPVAPTKNPPLPAPPQ